MSDATQRFSEFGKGFDAQRGDAARTRWFTSSGNGTRVTNEEPTTTGPHHAPVSGDAARHIRFPHRALTTPSSVQAYRDHPRMLAPNARQRENCCDEDEPCCEDEDEDVWCAWPCCCPDWLWLCCCCPGWRSAWPKPPCCDCIDVAPNPWLPCAPELAPMLPPRCCCWPCDAWFCPKLHVLLLFVVGLCVLGCCVVGCVVGRGFDADADADATRARQKCGGSESRDSRGGHPLPIRRRSRRRRGGGDVDEGEAASSLSASLVCGTATGCCNIMRPWRRERAWDGHDSMNGRPRVRAPRLNKRGGGRCSGHVEHTGATDRGPRRCSTASRSQHTSSLAFPTRRRASPRFLAVPLLFFTRGGR